VLDTDSVSCAFGEPDCDCLIRPGKPESIGDAIGRAVAKSLDELADSITDADGTYQLAASPERD
jgi:hypothetical protein